MKLLLVFLNNEYRPFVPPNLSSLEAYVKQGGHDVKVFDTSFYADILNIKNLDRNVKAGSYFGVDYSDYGIEILQRESSVDLLEMVNDYMPDLVGFSVYGYTATKADQLSQAIKDIHPNIPIIYGGIEVTLHPERYLEKDWVDIVCNGEGEKALLEVCNRIEDKKNLKNIGNIWVMYNGEVHKNDLTSFIDPNDIPLPDWSSYKSYQRYGPIEGKIYKLAMVEFNRGCPYSCTYCESTTLKNKYSEAGIKKYTRHKSPERFVKECRHLVMKYDIEYFYIVDGTFLTMPISVLRKLAPLFRKKVNRPFLCLTTAPSITEERAKLLHDMGCDQVNMGIETGNQQYRNNILGRPNITDELIVKAFAIIKSNRIKVSSYSMIGVPWQNREDIFDTIELNRKCKPDRTNVSIFIPFEGTLLTDRLINEGYISGDIQLGDETSCTVDVPTSMSREEIIGLHRTFNLYCKVPKELFPLINECEEDSELSEKILTILNKIYT